MPTFSEILKTLPGVTHIAALQIRDADGSMMARIDNKPGSAGSVAVYHAVSRPDGRLDRTAARHALTLYAEHVEAARAQPGLHPNIDRLFAVIDHDNCLHIEILEHPI